MRAATALAKAVRVLVRLQRKTVPLARKVRRVVWRRHAGEIIASAWRSRALRVRFAAAKASILKLQAHGRRLAARKLVAELREARRIEEEERFRLRSRKAAFNNGLARFALTKAARYATDRKVWDVPIGAHQGIAHPLAKAYMAVQQARLMTARAAQLFDLGSAEAGEAANISMATRNGFIEGSPRSIRRTPSRSSRGLIMPTWSTSSAAKNSDVMAAPAAGSSLPSKSDGRGIPS
jgi:hypothetical protein